MHNSLFRSLLVIAAVLVFYTNIPTYLVTVRHTSITPLDFMIFFGTVSLCVIVPASLIKHQIPVYFSKTVICWISLYCMISLLWFFFAPNPEIVNSVFRRRILSILFFLFFLFILSGSEGSQVWARRILLLSVCVAIFNNFLEFLNPSLFVSMLSEYANYGRSAGLYVNANQSGAALVLGMIFTVCLVPSKFRGAYVSSVLFAVLLTFSRSAVLGWILVIIIFTKLKMLRMSVLLYVVLGTGFLLYISLPVYLDYIRGQSGVNVANITERINWAMNPFVTENYSSNERKYLASLSWKMFMDSPFLGKGLGATETWLVAMPTHNMYLRDMAEHGIIGMFLLPLLAVSVIWKARGEAKQIAWPFLAFVLFRGFFTHNIVEEYYFLICFALMASMTYQSRLSNDKPI